MDDLDLAILIGLEDEESSEEETRRQESDIYRTQETEGAYEILIIRHLVPNDTKFKEYFRLSPELFHYVLNFIEEDIISRPSNRIKKPISPEQKLCIFLR
ncbi:hypothetical protein QE152_g9459 [Popillia japonica]|uniref:Maturase K n=1 Tax=Popillia japonica TaxID=7064 RepID=A0AAW1M0F1_POPJA